MKSIVSFVAMNKFEIARKGRSRFYYSPLFTVGMYEYVINPLVTFSNGEEAVAVFISRSELADILRTKFKNHPTRRRERAEKTRKLT